MITRSDAAAIARRPTEDRQSHAGADTIVFPKGLPGFEACRRFVLLASEEGLQVLTSVEGPAASFLVIDPRRVQADYRCRLSEADRLSLGAEATEPLLWLALVMVEADGSVTANLRAPVVINPTRMIGQQVIPYQCIYPLRHPLIEVR